MVDFMQTAIGELLNKAKLLDASKAWLEAITPGLEKKIIRDWIQEDQLFRQGVDEDGEIIGLYSQATEAISRGRKKAGEKFDLFDTGQFYRSMFINKLKDSIIIEADTAKMEDQTWWGDEILGLTDENFFKLVEEIKDGYFSYLRRVLGVGF